LSSVGSLVTVFGVFLFFFIIYDLFSPLGIFVETSSSFILYPYSRLVESRIPFFSERFEKAIYLFPKYQLANNYYINNYYSPDFYILFSEMLVSFKKIFKILKIFEFF
jgi:hypothetical protein